MHVGGRRHGGRLSQAAAVLLVSGSLLGGLWAGPELWKIGRTFCRTRSEPGAAGWLPVCGIRGAHFFCRRPPGGQTANGENGRNRILRIGITRRCAAFMRSAPIWPGMAGRRAESVKKKKKRRPGTAKPGAAKPGCGLCALRTEWGSGRFPDPGGQH